MAVTAEHLVVVGKGRLIADTTVAEVLGRASQDAAVHVRAHEATALREVLVADGATIAGHERGVLDVRGLSHERIGELGRPPLARPARAHPPDGVARRGVHAPDRRRRRVTTPASPSPPI